MNYQCVHAKSLQSCLILCDPMDCTPPGSSVHGILQARILEWVAIPSSKGSSRPTDRTCSSCVAGRFHTTWATGEAPELSGTSTFIYLFIYFYFFNFIFKFYNIVLVLPYIEMNPPQVYMGSPSWTLLPPPSPYHPSGSSQCTSPKHPV